jgi:hypothetical protein
LLEIGVHIPEITAVNPGIQSPRIKIKAMIPIPIHSTFCTVRRDALTAYFLTVVVDKNST